MSYAQEKKAELIHVKHEKRFLANILPDNDSKMGKIESEKIAQLFRPENPRKRCKHAKFYNYENHLGGKVAHMCACRRSS